MRTQISTWLVVEVQSNCGRRTHAVQERRETNIWNRYVIIIWVTRTHWRAFGQIDGLCFSLPESALLTVEISHFGIVSVCWWNDLKCWSLMRWQRSSQARNMERNLKQITITTHLILSIAFNKKFQMLVVQLTCETGDEVVVWGEVQIDEDPWIGELLRGDDNVEDELGNAWT